MNREKRPADWDDIVGHVREIGRIRRMMELDRLPHAFLFAGPSGIGKSLVADILSARLLQTETDSLSAHPDYFRLKPEGLLIRIGQIREIQRQVGLASSRGRYRVCMVEQAECMEAPAANSLLKILEEPPPGLVFILNTAFPHSLLSTLRSRSTLVRFSPLAMKEVVQVLVRQGMQPDAAVLAASLGGGSCGEAMGMDNPESMLNRNRAMKFLRSLPRQDQEWFWPLLSSLEESEPGQILDLIRQWIMLLRDLGMLRAGCPAAEPFNSDRRDELLSLAECWDIPRIAAAIKIAEETRRSLQRNANARLMLESLLIRSVDLYWGGKINADYRGGPV